ncbi:PHD and RING finger domain-containing protein 1 [Bienertia sinuspersici]
MMDPKTDMGKSFACGATISTTHGLLKADGVGLLNNMESCSQLSALSIASESSALNFVYYRKRLAKNPASVSPVTLPENISFVYERRKHQKSAVSNCPPLVSANSLPNVACTSAIGSENHGNLLCQKTVGLNEKEATRVSSLEQPLTTSETIDGYVTEDRGFDVKDKMNKTFELYSVDDSCSSSMPDKDMRSSPLKSKIDDTDECSSSGALAVDMMGDDHSLSVKGLCVSILQSHGLLSDSGSNRFCASEEDEPSCSGSSCSRTCNVCGIIGTAIDMLICDECEEAFHMSCFNPSIRKIPTDDWYCRTCSKKKHNLLKERAVRKSSIIRTKKGSVTSEGNFSPIALMLKDSEPYISGVRVGKGFQAIVPEWYGPVKRATGNACGPEKLGYGVEHDEQGASVYPEPMELNPSHPCNSLGPLPGKSRKAFIGNWLQCRDVILVWETALMEQYVESGAEYDEPTLQTNHLFVPVYEDEDGLDHCSEEALVYIGRNLQIIENKVSSLQCFNFFFQGSCVVEARRTAPLFEVQTDNWDCFRSVLWDATHADCAVPQCFGLGGVGIRLVWGVWVSFVVGVRGVVGFGCGGGLNGFQRWFPGLLKPRLAAKRRKLDIDKDDVSKVPIEDASVQVL